MKSDHANDLESLKSEVTNLTRLLDLKSEIESVRYELKLEMSRIKWIGTSVAFLAGIAGFFGVKAWSDITHAAQQTLASQISLMSVQAFDLARGFVLADARRYEEAIPFLTRSYDRNHYDESVDSALLDALISDGDYAAAQNIVAELRVDPKRFRELSNPLLLNNLGRVSIYYGIDDAKFLDEAQQLLEKSLRSFSPGAYSSKYPMFNLFRLYVLRDDAEHAAQYLAGAYRIDQEYANPAFTEDTWAQKVQRDNQKAAQLARKLIGAVGHSSTK